MSTTNGVSGSTSSTTAGSASAATQTTAKQLQDRFLTMLVAQMKNQDPLNPMDNAQVTSQMAQLSTVTGISNLNDTVNSMSSSVNQAQSMQAAALVGKNVLVPGNKLTLSSGSAVSAVDLSSDAGKVVITIKDSSGKVVHTADLGAQKAGVVGFQWDGKTDSGATAPDGKYTYTVTASAGGKEVTATALSVGQVLSVSLGSSGATLNFDGLNAASLSDVRQIM